MPGRGGKVKDEILPNNCTRSPIPGPNGGLFVYFIGTGTWTLLFDRDAGPLPVPVPGSAESPASGSVVLQ